MLSGVRRRKQNANKSYVSRVCSMQKFTNIINCKEGGGVNFFSSTLREVIRNLKTFIISLQQAHVPSSVSHWKDYVS